MSTPRQTTDTPRELECSGELCLAFVNTASPRRDDRSRRNKPLPRTPLTSYSVLLDWTLRMGAVGSDSAEMLMRAATDDPDEAARILERALALRACVTRIFFALARRKPVPSEDLLELNDTLAEALAYRRVVTRGDGFEWDWKDAGAALDQVLWPIAHSAATLLTSDRRRRIGRCVEKGCRCLFIDRSGRRKWCDPNTCGNRAKGRRHYKMMGSALSWR